MATILLCSFELSAQQMKPTGQYPEPRYPKIRKIEKAEDLLDIARVVVRKPSRRDPLRPGYDIKSGERALIVVDSNFDRLVLDAIAMAIREAGGRPDILITDAMPRRPAEGWQEIGRMGGAPRARGGRYSDVIKLAALGDYDILIHGSGGPIPLTPFRWEYIPWDRIEKFVTGVPDFPAEVQDLIDKKIWEVLKRAKRIRVTDAEGTDLSWSIKPEYFDLLKKEWPGYEVVLNGHISLTPLFAPPEGIDAQGVIAGTINHTGIFPHIKLYIEKGRIARIEGGGRYGELWRQFLNEHKDLHVPGFPGAGAGWFIEAALGTNPRAARLPYVLKEGWSTSWERVRSGVIHFGLGISKPPDSYIRAEYNEFLRKHNLSGGHFHVHTHFNTIEVETVDGEKIKIADRGHITFLDDPEVKKLAAKYGNPDEILSEAWVPAIPGVNVEGDYQRDFAVNPAAWIEKEVEAYYGKR